MSKRNWSTQGAQSNRSMSTDPGVRLAKSVVSLVTVNRLGRAKVSGAPARH